MKETKSYNVIYDYDEFCDNLGIRIDEKFKYLESVEMEDGIILDFDVMNRPVSLEVLDASKRLNIPKESLNNIVFFKMEVAVEEKSICLNAVICVLIDDVENTKNIELFTSNSSHIPDTVSELASV